MESRNTHIRGFYCNLLNWKNYKTKTWFPYTTSINDKILRDNLLKHFNLLIAESISYLEGKIIRIGHIGENSKIQYIVFTLTSLQKELELLGFKLDLNLTKSFLDEIYK